MTGVHSVYSVMSYILYKIKLVFVCIALQLNCKKMVSIFCGKYSKYSTCELVLPMHSFQNWFSLWWLNMIFKWKNQSWSPIVFFYFDIFNKMLFLGVKDMKSQVDILSFFIEHLSFCFHSYFFHFTDLHKTYVHIMYIRVGHPFFSKEHSDLCVLFRSL